MATAAARTARGPQAGANTTRAARAIGGAANVRISDGDAPRNVGLVESAINRGEKLTDRVNAATDTLEHHFNRLLSRRDTPELANSAGYVDGDMPLGQANDLHMRFNTLEGACEALERQVQRILDL